MFLFYSFFHILKPLGHGNTCCWPYTPKICNPDSQNGPWDTKGVWLTKLERRFARKFHNNKKYYGFECRGGVSTWWERGFWAGGGRLVLCDVVSIVCFSTLSMEKIYSELFLTVCVKITKQLVWIFQNIRFVGYFFMWSFSFNLNFLNIFTINSLFFLMLWNLTK